MKLPKLLHILSVIVGFTGVIVFAGAILGGSDNIVFGITNDKKAVRISGRLSFFPDRKT